MIIPLNQKAIVRCSDGICYPCIVQSIITNDNLLSTDYMPKYGVKLLQNPSDVPARIVVKMDKVFFGGQQ